MGALRKGLVGIIIMASLGVYGARAVPDTTPPQTPLSLASRVPRERYRIAVTSTPMPSAFTTLTPRRIAPLPKPKFVAIAVPTGGGWSTAFVSWYGPGLYGNGMAGGGRLTPTSMVVAHRYMKFGTRIMFKYRGRTCIAVVRDRGPYIGGRQFDLGPGVAHALGFQGVGYVQWRIIR